MSSIDKDIIEEIKENLASLESKVQELQVESTVDKLKAENMNVMLKKLDKVVFGNGTSEDLGLMGRQMKHHQYWVIAWVALGTIVGVVVEFLKS